MVLLDIHKDSIQGKIIWLLAENYPLSASEIYDELGLSKRISYQYVHRIVKRLYDNGNLEKRGSKYVLKHEWLIDVKKFLDIVDTKYKLGYSLFSRAITSEMLHILSKQDSEKLKALVQKTIADFVTSKLHEWYSAYYDPKRKETKRIRELGNFKGKRVLEIGCGTGRITRDCYKGAKKWVATDYNEDQIKYCKEKYNFKNVEFEIMDYSKLNEKELGKFDVIVSGWVGLHYKKEDEKKRIIKAFYNLLKKNGKLIIIEAYPDSEYVKIIDYVTQTPNKILFGLDEIEKVMNNQFKDIQGEILESYYVFPSEDVFAETFKIELQFEEHFPWTSAMDKRLNEWINEKKEPKNKVGESAKIFVSRKINHF